MICLNTAMAAFFKAFSKTGSSLRAHFASYFHQCERKVSQPCFRKLQQALILVYNRKQTNANILNRSNYAYPNWQIFLSRGQAGFKATMKATYYNFAPYKELPHFNASFDQKSFATSKTKGWKLVSYFPRSL